MTNQPRARKDTRKTGKAGELLVQYRLLKREVESAPMTTDTGVDLVAFAHLRAKPTTIQVKSTRGDDDGVVWTVRPDKLEAVDVVALVDIKWDKVWLFSREDFERLSIGRRAVRRLGWYPPDDPRATGKHKLSHEEGFFKEFELDAAVSVLWPDFRDE